MFILFSGFRAFSPWSAGCTELILYLWQDRNIVVEGCSGGNRVLFLRQALSKRFSLALNLLCSPDWPGTPASASCVLVLRVCVIPGYFMYFK